MGLSEDRITIHHKVAPKAQTDGAKSILPLLSRTQGQSSPGTELELELLVTPLVHKALLLTPSFPQGALLLFIMQGLCVVLADFSLFPR